jgi:hypothetical protein
MNNLDYCTKKTKDSVKRILENPATHTLAKETIMAGLNKDCVDTVVRWNIDKGFLAFDVKEKS